MNIVINQKFEDNDNNNNDYENNNKNVNNNNNNNNNENEQENDEDEKPKVIVKKISIPMRKPDMRPQHPKPPMVHPKPPMVHPKPPMHPPNRCAMRFWRKGRYNKFIHYWTFVKRPGWQHCWIEQKGRWYLKKVCWGKNYYEIFAPFWRFCRKGYRFEKYWGFSRGFYRVKHQSWPVFFSRTFYQVYGNDITYRPPNEF